MDTSLASTTTNPPRWYWIVSVLAVLWMLIGVAAWTADLMTDEASIATMSEAQQQLYRARPQWLFIVYALAIFSGLVGSIGLLIRKRWSTLALSLSLAAIVVQFGYTFFGLDAIRILGAAQAVPFPALIFAIGAGVLWLSLHARKRGWM